VSCIPQNEIVVLAGDMNRHVGSNNAGYDRTHGGYGFGARNAGGSRILEFADGLDLVICSTPCFIKSGPLCILAITFSNVDRFE